MFAPIRPFVGTSFALTILLCFSVTDVAAAETEQVSADSPVLYEQHVRPIFKAYCFHCHGEEPELAGGIDLRLRRTLVAGGDSGTAVVPGDAFASLLVDYVRSGEMPPQEEQRLSAEEVAVIERWIETGAEAGPEPEQTPKPGEFFITESERDHWAFRPLRVTDPPPTAGPLENEAAGDHPIDRFVARKLAEQGLSFSPQADRVTLIRRATFDLTGLPPTPDEVQAFVEDTSPDAYARLIDRLLDSPRYGERWGRHWLDVAGYADSEGYTDGDPLRPDAWPYRDYVVASLNADKPWDRFLVEQLAGDELVGVTHADAAAQATSDESVREKLVATGFLRLAPDGTGDRPMDLELAKKETITQTVNIVSSALLGVTVGCAECHDHRFDPIPQEDFYRLRAIFEPVFDPDNWKAPAQRRVAILAADDQSRAEQLEAEAKVLDDRHDRLKQETVEQIFRRVLETIPEDRREFAIKTFETPANERTEEQKTFFQEQYPMLNVTAGRLHLFLERYEDGDELKAKYETLLEESKQIRSQKPQPDLLRVATEDTKRVPGTFVYHRGDLNSPADEPVMPGTLRVLQGVVPSEFPDNDPSLPTTGRRLAFARSLVSGDHPLLPRVLVNRFWMHHFGQPLVESSGDFGLRADPPSHPELLDWLADDFMRHGWHLKRFHRLLMTSRAYRQTSTRRGEGESVDADNRLLWRMPVRRLESEAVRDAILAVSGELSSESGGPPTPVAVDDVGLVTVSGGENGWRRSLFTQYRRSQPVYLLEAFDNPNMEPNCERRVASTVATQSLTMMNDPFIVAQASAFAERLRRETPPDAEPADAEPASAQLADAESPDAELPDATLTEQVDRAWLLAFGRLPADPQRQKLTEYVRQQTEDFRKRKVDQPERQAIASLCQVIFASNAFLYID